MSRHLQLPTLNRHDYFILPESVGWYWDMPEHQVARAPGALNNFSIHLITGGRGYVETKEGTMTLSRGDAFLFFPLQPQRYYSDEDDPWDVRWMHFYGNTLKEYMLERGFQSSSVWTVRSVKPLEQALSELLEEAEQHAFLRPTRLSALTYAALAEFVAQASPLSSARTPEAADKITPLLPRIQAEACRAFDLAYWAAEAGVSTYYFCKLFKKTTRMTPMTFVTLCRLQISKQWLLEKRDLTVKDIAADAGYPSTSYFNKRFLEQEGMTPTEYRQLYQRQ
ncbi:AraC family transcriptional regulator [Paenibacillus filicis]|uniref:AraC family transcriptional regulator n=1 Tax=Paenibacillus gyeongsangnamensis TaxID=3388067 RepID=A0ABT4QGC7_9BACL|nr:AraC family transcriptional regulator [Paenibacillus filicis]MCZ8515921.1 AraC family transcriptional regulator [Paenibacillus filicis]